MVHSCGLKRRCLLQGTAEILYQSIPVLGFLADQLTKGSPMVVMLEVRIQKSYITEYLEVGTQKSPAWNAQTKTEFCSFCKQWLDFELRGLLKHLTVTEVELLQLF